MLPLQEIFNRGLTAIRQQGKPSMKPGTQACLYRAPDGSKCLIGHFIPDGVYNADWDDPAASQSTSGVMGLARHDNDFLTMLVSQGLVSADNPHSTSRLSELRELQSAHDEAGMGGPEESFLERFEKEMARTARELGLYYEEPAA